LEHQPRNTKEVADAENRVDGLARFGAFQDSPCRAATGGARRHRRTFAWKYLLSFALVFALIVAISWLGNGSGCFVSPLCPSMNDRPYKTRCLEALVAAHRSPEILILGSSRVMQLKPNYINAITGKRTFNYAVAGGNLVDCLTQFRYAVKIGAKPEVLVLDITGWGLDVSGGQRFLAANAGLAAEIPGPERLAVLGVVFRSINLRSTLASVRALIDRAMHGAHKDGLALIDGETVILRDGYRFNWKLTAARAKGEFDLSAVLSDRIENTRIFHHDEAANPSPQPSPRWLECLRELLLQAMAAGVEVHVITTPMHPQFNALFLTDASEAAHDGLIRTLRSECAKVGAHFHDFSALDSFGGSADEFWDHCHQSPANMERMADSLFGVPASAKRVHVQTDVEVFRSIRGK
jgi:hypothetical protein